MKTLFAILALSLPALAAVPLRWSVETSRAQTTTFDVYRGETLSLAADLSSYGQPLALAGSVALYCQTNGMGDAWWIVPATVASNRIEAVLSPSNYPGDAQSLNCFLGGPATSYRAAFRLRVIGAPGPAPNTVSPPVVTLDFSQISVANPPYWTRDEADSRYGGSSITSTVVTNIAEFVTARDSFSLVQTALIPYTAAATEATNAYVMASSHVANRGNPHNVTAAQVGAYDRIDSITLFDGHYEEDWDRPRILICDTSNGPTDLAGVFYGGQLYGIRGERRESSETMSFRLAWPWGWTGTIATSNMVDSMVDKIPSTYAHLDEIASVNCSVQAVVDPSNNTLPTFEVPAAVPGGVRDWIVHVVSSGDTDITVTGFPATVDGGKTANFFSTLSASDITKACTHGTITTFTFSEINSTQGAVNFFVMRAELQRVNQSN